MTLSKLFDPGVVAVVGASRTEGKIGHEVMASLSSFHGTVHPVNPNAEGTLFGRDFVPSVGEIGGTVDLACLCVPPPVVPEVLAECGHAGVGAAVVYAGGFAEAGEEGRERQARVRAVAEEHGIAVLGPNTSGFAVPGRGLVTSFVEGIDRVPPGDVAVVAQSGGIAHVLAFQATGGDRGVSATVGLGNRVGVDFPAAIEYFDRHDPTGAIALHVEGTDDARGLLETCRAVETPVVAYKVGGGTGAPGTGGGAGGWNGRADPIDGAGSDGGGDDGGGRGAGEVEAFARSHTGALTGDRGLYRGGFRQYGVVSAGGTTELLDAGRALAGTPVPAGPNVGLLTAQAGPGIAMADRLTAAGARFPAFEPATRETVRDVLPGITYAGNPVDTGRPMPEFGDVAAAMVRDANVELLLVYQLYEPAVGYPVEALSGLPAETGTPVLFATDAPAGAGTGDLAALEDGGIPTFTTPERGADAAATLVEFARLHGVEDCPAGGDGESGDPEGDTGDPPPDTAAGGGGR